MGTSSRNQTGCPAEKDNIQSDVHAGKPVTEKEDIFCKIREKCDCNTTLYRVKWNANQEHRVSAPG